MLADNIKCYQLAYAAVWGLIDVDAAVFKCPAASHVHVVLSRPVDRGVVQPRVQSKLNAITHLLRCNSRTLYNTEAACRHHQNDEQAAHTQSGSQRPAGRPQWLLDIRIWILYGTRVLHRAWGRMDKVSIGIGRFQLHLPRLHTSGPAAVFGYVILSAIVICCLFVLMDYARAITLACIQWQQAQ